MISKIYFSSKLKEGNFVKINFLLNKLVSYKIFDRYKHEALTKRLLNYLESIVLFRKTKDQQGAQILKY